MSVSEEEIVEKVSIDMNDMPAVLTNVFPALEAVDPETLMYVAHLIDRDAMWDWLAVFEDIFDIRPWELAT